MQNNHGSQSKNQNNSHRNAGFCKNSRNGESGNKSNIALLHSKELGKGPEEKHEEQAL